MCTSHASTFAAFLIVGLCITARAEEPDSTSTELAPTRHPNILWITCEDISPNLSCYGDNYAITPHLDRLASQGVRYTSAFAACGVCSPSRSSLITGMYANSLGTQHHRSHLGLPKKVKCLPTYLRQAGYYCTNNAKTDYNFAPPRDAWDENGRRAHWRHRPAGRAFFAVFNFTSTHESRIFQSDEDYSRATAGLTDAGRHDPAMAPLPPYHPDALEVRRDWARYYDMITVMDQQVGQLLDQLDADGLADDTIVFFFSDHGAGMPRSKRWLYDSGLRVPLLVRIPEQYSHLAPGEPGTSIDRLVSLVDLAPTVVSLADVDIPKHMQGSAFLGNQSPPRENVFGFRDRMDERYDLQRCVRDNRFKYIRNFRPDLPYFHDQSPEYALRVPTLQVWQRLADDGKLGGPAATFMKGTKPIEELYDVISDPWEVHNLASDPGHRATLKRMRHLLDEWMDDVVDLGLLPEAELRSRFGDRAPYEAVRESPSSGPVYRPAEVRETIDLASFGDERATARLIAQLAQPLDPATRFWSAIGLGGAAGNTKSRSECLERIIHDEEESPIVRVAAAESLCRLNATEAAIPVLASALDNENEWIRLYAANVLDRTGKKALPALEQLQRGRKDSNPCVAIVCRHAVRNLVGAN